MLERETTHIREILSQNIIKASVSFDNKTKYITVKTDDLEKAESVLRGIYDCYISKDSVIVYNGNMKDVLLERCKKYNNDEVWDDYKEIVLTDTKRSIKDMDAIELQNVKNILKESKINAQVSYNENYKCIDVDNFENNRSAIEAERILSKSYDCELHDEDKYYWIGIYEVLDSFEKEFEDEEDYDLEEITFMDSAMPSLVERLAKAYKNGNLNEFVNDYLEDNGKIEDLKKAMIEIEDLSLSDITESVEKYEENSLEPKTKPLERLSASQRREIREVLNKYDNFKGRGKEVFDLTEELKEIGYPVILEKVIGWDSSNPKEPYKDYVFRFVGYKDFLNARVYANENYDIIEFTLYIG